MSRFVLAILSIFALLGVFLSGMDVLTIERSSGGTVYQQMVATMRFGFSVLAFILSLGFFALLGAIERRPDHGADQTKALKEIADATSAARALLEAPVKKAEAEAAEREAEEKKARYAAYRESLKGGGRLDVEAAMLANAQTDKNPG